MFTVHDELDAARSFYRTVKASVAAHGRDPARIRILPGIVPIIGDSESAARARECELNELIVSPRAVAALGERLHLDLQGHDLDAPLPPLPPVEQFPGQQGRYRVIKEMAERGSLTVRQIIHRLSPGRGHHTVVGDPEQIADEMAVWHAAGAADGFTVLPPLLPEGAALFLDHVVPALRRRGLFRDGYRGATLRDHYGLPRPLSRGSGTVGG